ncbi:copper chaperone PCu(A)C [Nocardiopsis sp. FIRDI 009]|uniref:copper chaperone PCu(A)C n=1 Tax=Nocardiopsis sp. FIRDI 009 TaxID=714197 RepID=UPI001E43BFE2|nr:copper chaperone PCu(A)C [Nocardiopsis sp. FIRDI 009]
MRRRVPGAVAVGAAALLAVTACGGTEEPAAPEAAADHAAERGTAEAGDLRISGAWMPEPANPEVGAVYLRVENGAEADDAITAVTADASDDADLYTTETTDSGASMMRAVEEIPVPGGGATELMAGGYHVMVNDLPEPLAVGDEVVLTLTFASEHEVEVTAPVQPMTAGDGGEDAHEGHH